ncbi:MAG: putative sulfate exporter family transporter [Idiomarina sp.]|nr:putative sulfate exporter family transporter [Idiomarina sp.]
MSTPRATEVVSIKHILFVFIGLICLTPLISAPVALLLGMVFAIIGWVPGHIDIQRLVKLTLAVAIVGLGFGMQLSVAWNASLVNLPALLAVILGALILGALLARLLGLERPTGQLLSVGTAICGGSAIAALAPAIQAKAEQIGVALGIVFVLNAFALWVFPLIGDGLGLTQYQFGVWAALAIHDTSSVVAAAQVYGEEALAVATPLKLTRALFIVPLVLLMVVVMSLRNRSEGRFAIPKVPVFIVLYVVAMLCAEFVPAGAEIYSVIFAAAKALLVLCLYLIGASLSLRMLKNAGWRPMLFAVVLWLVVGGGTLAYVYQLTPS